MNPTALVTIDFETYYDTDYSLSKLTTEAYVRDPRFETIGVGVKVGAEPAVWMSDADFRAWAARVDWARVAVLCHHTHFDGFILSHHYGIRPGFLFDTLGMSRALHPETGGSLAKLMVAYAVGEKGHEVVLAKGKRRADFTPAEWLQYGVYCCNDCDGTYRIFRLMLAKGFPEPELRLNDLTIRMFTEPVLEGDIPLLTEFLAEEKAKKRKLLARVAGLLEYENMTDEQLLELVKPRLTSDAKFAALLTEFGAEVPQKLNKAGVLKTAFAKTDPGMQALLEHEDEEIRWLAEARQGVKSSQNETRTERFISCASRGPMPVYLKYYGAHTGRWSGGDGMNMQNLHRGGVLRKSLLAPEGHVVVVADSGAIEARMTAWFAGHHELVEAFRQNKDIYSEFASSVYGRKVDRKFKLADGTEPDEEPGRVGKTAILGLGYSMGYLKFGMTLLSGAGGKPIRFSMEHAHQMGVDVNAFARNPYQRGRVEDVPSRLSPEDKLVHFAVCDRIVDTYREVNAPIAALWEFMNDVVIPAMVDGHEMSFGPNDCCRTVRHGIVLPNGMMLRYRGLTRHVDEKGRSSFTYIGSSYGNATVRIYGGSLTENVIQALARIVIGEQALAVHAMNGKIPTTTHDEILVVVRLEKAKRALIALLTEMFRAPTWATGCPLSAEGGFHRSYGAVKKLSLKAALEI